MKHQQYMWRAIDLASRAEAESVSPNPKVGAVLVYQGRIIGEGYHQKSGEPHAEVNCLASVRTADRSLLPHSTMYVTLEPCAHEGRTPSCAKRLAEEQVKEVVIGTLDPNPLTAGKGVKILQDAGISVAVGCLEAECQEVAKVFLTHQLKHRPFITLKWAESSDGYLDHHRTSAITPPAKLSTPFTQLLVHRVRSQHAGVLVGHNTLKLDTPKLNNRLWLPSPYSPRPILLSCQHLELPENWLQIDEISRESLRTLLNEHGITSLLVEGGTATHQAFVERGLWDEIRREVSPTLLHEGVSAPILPHDARLVGQKTYSSGNTILEYRRQ